MGHELLFEFLFKPLKFVIEVVISVDAQVVADTAAVGGNGFVVRNSIEME